MRALSLAATAALLLAAAAPAMADSKGPRVGVIADPLVIKECGACHMAFQPEFLTTRSWEKIFADLSNHFGDDASLADPAKSQIRTYYLTHAADRASGKEARRVAAEGGAPLRITETATWIRHHRPGEVDPRAFNDPKVKSKANCKACHGGADQGYYEE
jgi:hypothetical protein